MIRRSHGIKGLEALLMCGIWKISRDSSAIEGIARRGPLEGFQRISKSTGRDNGDTCSWIGSMRDIEDQIDTYF